MNRTYYGFYIHHNTEPNKLRWWALAYGRMFAADTLAGIKSLLRDEVPSSMARARGNGR